jgi:N6-adenosine-specific RNA methylase IME4
MKSKSKLIRPPGTVIYANPPWATKSVDELCSLPIRLQVPDKHCFLFLSVPAPKLPLGLRVLESWGFEYKTHAVWDGGHPEREGVYPYFYSVHEDLLAGKRGAPPLPLAALRRSSIIRANGLLTKEDAICETLEHMFPDSRRIELFRSGDRAGWERFE